ncbi:delta-60 repeat domain-containing protein [bacterium]|nr:delta-60 repeat domain-containing protein [bacterium]
MNIKQYFLSTPSIIALTSFLLTSCGGKINASLDSSEQSTVNRTYHFNQQVKHVSVRSDDKIIVGGSFTEYGPLDVGRFLRLNADGSLDESCQYSKFDNTVMDVALLPDQSMIVVGLFMSYGNQPARRIAKLKPDCTLDQNFHNTPNTDSYFIKVALQGSKILVGGRFSNYDGYSQGGLARLHSDGSIDSSFNSGQVGFDGAVMAIRVQDDDSILVGHGGTHYNTVALSNLTKLNPDGGLDTSFFNGDTPGHSTYRSSLINPVFAIEELPCSASNPIGFEGNPGCKNIAAAGAVTWYEDATYIYNQTLMDGIGLIKNDGSFNESFKRSYDGQIYALYDLMYDSNEQSLWIAGGTELYGIEVDGIAKMDINGNLDPNFFSHNNLGFHSPAEDFDSSGNPSDFPETTDGRIIVYSLAQQSNGKVIVGGMFTHYNHEKVNYFTRLNTDGSLDLSFGL